MTQSAEALRQEKLDGVLEVTLSGSVGSGEIVLMADGRAGVLAGLRDLESGDVATYITEGGHKIKKSATGSVNFAVGDDVYWDASANSAVRPGLALDGAADILIGPAVAPAANGDDHVKADVGGMNRFERALQRFVYEFDCENGGGDTDEHVLIPSELNTHGFVFFGAFALVTEVFGGDSEDQGIVTIEDEDDNALSTLTASNAGADSIGDVILGTNGLFSASSLTTGGAAKTIAAGKAVQGFVSQQTSGTGKAGKMKVYVLVLPLV